MTHPLEEGILYTDFYQLTMAQVYFEMGLHEREARFEHFFRSYPNYGAHQAGYCVMAGLQPLVEWMQRVRFGEAEIAALRAQRSPDDNALFQEDFLAWLAEHGDFSKITLEAVPEGRVVHPHIPLSVVTGPLAMAQILETALLNQLNFGTLIATKAARVRESAGEATVMEFGLRRAQGFAANGATRAALIGGADFTSNTGASIRLGLPPRGTHAHALVQATMAMGMSELDAFRQYATRYPDSTVLLVDTVDTLRSGVPNAITIFQELQAQGHKPVGIRLDSGDLAYLSMQSARLLDEAGFPEASIVLSNDLDELIIWQIESQIRQEAARMGVEAESVIRRLVFGVGTKLVTSEGDGALGGVYKLVALRDAEGHWQPAIKISESAEKTPTPGVKRAYRLYDERGVATADLLALADEKLQEQEMLELRHPFGQRRRVVRREGITLEPLHQTILERGVLREEFPSLGALRARRRADIARLDPGVRRLINPHIYHISLTPSLWTLKQQLIEQARAGSR
ncbi:MAG: nicotinate phosphoribosyltransferase [Ardenticatenales bacterium]|nr:nicotinate phosphoribosyltransferase [Ardenticatenales bacterium]